MPDKTIKFSKSLLHPRHFPSWVILFVAWLLSLLPQRVRHWIGDLIGSYLYRNNQKRRMVVEKNLRQVFQNIDDDALCSKVESSLSWYGRALVEYSTFFFASKQKLKGQVAINGLEHLNNLKSKEAPIILMLAHSVMLEFAVVALLSEGYHSFGSYKASSDPVLDWMIAKSRCRFTDFVVSREEGLRPLIRAIKSGRIMVFLPDEDLGLDNAIFASFFGRAKATLTTPARLSKMGGANAIAGFVAFEEASKQYVLNLKPLPECYPSGNPELDATSLNAALEALILENPEQYIWTMKVFRTTLDQDERFY